MKSPKILGSLTTACADLPINITNILGQKLYSRVNNKDWNFACLVPETVDSDDGLISYIPVALFVDKDYQEGELIEVAIEN